MCVIAENVLREVCDVPLEKLQSRQAFHACRRLGRLARWWLRPKVLELAHAYNNKFPAFTFPERPALPNTLGACWVVLAMKEERLPLLRRAFLLPLCWAPDQAHADSLPPKLVALAERVVSEALPLSAKQRSWGLGLADCVADCQLSDDLAFTFDSGWAALAAGLILRNEGLLPQPDVWASGAWDQHGLADIDGEERKLELALEWQARDFFLPVWKVGAARDWLKRHGIGSLSIGALNAMAEPDVAMTLRDYLARLEARPEPPVLGSANEEEQFNRCRDYYLRQQPFHPETRKFYWSHLLPGIIRQRRAQVQQDWPGLRASHFITIVSRSHELAVLAPQAVGAAHCLLFHTPDLQGLADDCAKMLRQEKVHCVLRPFTADEKMAGSLAQEAHAWVEGVPPDQVVVDVKPGTKKMTYACSRLAQPGNWIFNLESKFLEGRHNTPGSERVELWQAGPSAS